MTNILQSIHKGMTVFDLERNEIGTVEYVQFGDETDADPGTESTTVSPALKQRDNSLVGDLMSVFVTDKVPEALRSRLMLSGFVRLESSGLFSSDRYISPDQIRSVEAGHVILNVYKKDLIKQI